MTIKKNERKGMTKAEAEKKVEEVERMLLEARGEGKKEKTKALKKTIAQLKTIINMKK